MTGASKAVGTRIAAIAERVELGNASFLLLTAFALCYPLTLSRRGMIDQANYLDYFAQGRTFEWLTSAGVDGFSLLQLVGFVVEEPLWLVWTSLLGSILAPLTCIYATVFVINATIATAVRALPRASLALGIWLAVPVGFAVIGTYQIRQGLAFALWLLIVVRARRPVVASVVAGFIHSTFLIVAPVAFIASRRVMPPTVRLTAIAGFAVTFSLAGQQLFEAFGGRRLSIYLDTDQTFSFNFVLSLLILLPCTLLPAFALRPDPRLDSRMHEWLKDYSILQAGLLVYMVICFFLFPLGLFRINYLAILGLIPLFATLDQGSIASQRFAPLGNGVVLALATSYIAYFSIDALMNDRFACVIVENCARVLAN